MSKRVNRAHLLEAASKLEFSLVAVTVLGLALRLLGANYGLPYTYGPDEPTYITIALTMLRTGDLNPHWWYYPTLMFYVTAITYALYYGVGHLIGLVPVAAGAAAPFPEIVTMGVGRLARPDELLIARGLTALFSAASVPVAYAIGRRLASNRWVAILAALFFAVSPTAVSLSHRFGPDVYAMFFDLVAFFFILRIVDDPRLRNYAFAGLAAGLAIASKYNAGFVLVALVVAHLIRFGRSGWRRKELFVAAVAAAGAFVVASPFALLDFSHFWDGVLFQANSYTVEGHAGQEGGALAWYVNFLWQTEGPVVLLAALSIVIAAFRRNSHLIVLASFPVLYFAFVSQLLIRNDRTILLVIPFLCVQAAELVVSALVELKRRQPLPTAAIATVGVAVAALLAVPNAQTAYASDMRLLQADSRETARVWIEHNLPAGTRIAEESYSPYVDTEKYVVQGVSSITDHSPNWYAANGFEYLVFSQGMYGRFFADPQLYSESIDKYDEFFSSLALVKQFDDNGYEIRVYKTGAALPAHRVAARFGNYGEFVELVGYDDVRKWEPGDPLQVTLAWRALADQSEPLALTLHLLDSQGKEVSSVSGDLFRGQGWPEGIFTDEWTIPAPPDAIPGAYRVVVSVMQTRFEYVTPAKNWAGDDVGKVTLGPFKLSVAPPPALELQQAQNAGIRLGDNVELRSYVPPQPTRDGDTLHLTLYWQAQGKPAADYTVFVHLVDAQGRLRAQVDSQPRASTYPTSLWDDGEIVRDDYALELPSDLAPGTYRIEIGMYELASLNRLTISDASGKPLGNSWIMTDAVQVLP
ncbi:MAG: glycosyltransferase family 39 protein [Chloroflexi bacterium]|nr:glycosyltransferase family 39 protein [Chloroflexota bacterium]